MNTISTPTQESRAILVIRTATIRDVDEICELVVRAYPGMAPYTSDMVRGHITNFNEGTFVAVYENRIVGYCATFRISGGLALHPHSWGEITGGGYNSRHDQDGEFLYGMEVCVDPEYRGLRIGQRLYNERKKLCKHLRLRGIVFGGRLPMLSKRIRQIETPERYIEMVQEKKMRDPVLSFQLRNGFQVLGLMKNYLPSDHDSMGYAAHLVWYNPSVSQDKTDTQQRTRTTDTVRVAAVQYLQRRVSSFEEFSQIVEYFVDVVADYGAEFILFPELFTLQLLSIENKPLPPAESIEALTNYTNAIKSLLSDLAVRYNINIIGGSHPTHDDEGQVRNECYVCLRDGSIHSQPKIHPTPNERYWWNIQGGNKCSVIQTDCGPIGVLICYDSEFPELARHLINQGAQILFVPFCTDERQSYLRVRYCSQARAVENQCFMVLAGNVGNLPGVMNMDIQYAQSCILTPCDFPFARDGVAADTTPNVEMVAIGDLRLENLLAARNNGTVQNLKDRRFDLYSINWHGSLVKSPGFHP